MPKTRTVFRCQQCGASAPKWAGQCGSCQEWNTLVEELEVTGSVPAGAAAIAPSEPAVPIDQIDTQAWLPVSTGVDELDRVLTGGLVPGSVTLVGGEPGIGKSTLLLQAAAAMATGGRRVLYSSAEESRPQVRLRAERLDALSPRLLLGSDSSLPHLLGQIQSVRPDIVVVDSIQAMHDPALGSAPGTVAQVRECAHRLVIEAKAHDISVVLVGHVTKDGNLAGPRVLEHVVDTVLSFEGDRYHALRLLRAVKHRFGATDQLGLFEMTGTGLAGVPDPSRLFLADRRPGVAGSVVVPTIEGMRPLLVEVQALATATELANPRRSAQGLDKGRLALIAAVLDQRVGIKIGGRDLYVSAVGGVKIVEPGADLAVAISVASALRGRPIPPDVVAVGEVGLGGELRMAAAVDRRLAEAARLGFTRAVVPASCPDGPDGIALERVPTLIGAVAAVDLLESDHTESF